MTAPRDAVRRMRWAVEAERARRDAHWLIFDSNYAMSKDEHDAEHPVKSTPDDPYLRALLDCLLVSGRILPAEDARWALAAGTEIAKLQRMASAGLLMVEKSRQMFVTWLVCHYLRWRASTRPHQLILVQSKKEEDANNLVFNKDPDVGRISFIERHLPRHLRSLEFPRNAAAGRLYYPNGSQIWGIPEGGAIIRSNTASVVFSDEACYQPEWGESYTAALPAVKGGGQYIAVSSAAPGEFEAVVSAREAA